MTEHYLKAELYDRIRQDDDIFEFIQASALDAMWYWDLEEPDHQWMNPRFWVMLGYEPEDMPHRVDAWLNRIDPEDLQRARENLQAHLEDPDHPYDQILRFRHRDGSTIWIRSRGMAIRSEEGTPLRMLGTHLNVTRYKEAETRARQEAQLYKAFVDNQSAYLLRIDRSGTYTFVNDAYCADLGWSRDELLGNSSLIGIVEEDHAAARSVGEACFAEPGSHHRARLRKRLATGEVYIADWEFTALLDDAGQASELLCIGFDVTQRVRAEDALVRANTMLNDAQRIAGMGAWELDLDSGEIVWTEEVYAIHELAPNIPQSKLESLAFYHPDDQRVITNAVNEAINQHRPYELQCRLITARGNERWVRFSGNPIVDNGRTTRLVGILQDITERKRTRDALAESEARFRSFVENSGDLIVTLSPRGDMLYISPMWEALNGFSADGLSGTSLEPLIHPDDRGLVREALETVVSRNVVYDGLIYRSRHGDGSWHWLSANASPIQDAGGSVSTILLTIRDITVDKQAEATMRATLTRLERTLAHNQLLVREVHHRVKNNLAVIASLLNLQADELQDGGAREALRDSRERVLAMSQIHELMYGHDNARTIAFDHYLRSLVERMERSLTHDQRRIRFTLSLASLRLPFDQAIPVALIVNELLTNATKYAFPADQSDAQVTIDMSTGARLELAVTDNGVGLSDDGELDKVDSLGMTVIRSFTEELQGEVVFENRPQPGIGLRVLLSIPRAE